MYAQCTPISNLCVYLVHASVPYAYMFSMCRRNLCSVCISAWHVCSVHLWVPDAYAQCMHKFLMRMLGARISSLCVCSAYQWRSEHTRKFINILNNFYSTYKKQKYKKVFIDTNKWSGVMCKELCAPKWTPNIFRLDLDFSSKIAHPEILYVLKIIKIQAIKYLTLVHL